jgi:hypothetical protein
MEGWRDGGMEGWRDGGMEGWRDGGMEECDAETRTRHFKAYLQGKPLKYNQWNHEK